MKKIILLILLTTSIVLSQDIPRYIAYQGVLIDKNKQLKPDGDYSIKFELYDDEFTGTLIWNKTFNPIKVVNGVFGELLGPFDNTVKFDKQYFVQITVGTEQLSKRVPLTSSAYALGIANNSVSNSKIQSKAVTEDKISDNSISNKKIADGAVSSSKIQDGEVIETKLADKSVSSRIIQANSVIESKISDNSVSNRTIQTNSIDSSKIIDKSISYNDLSTSSASTGNVLTFNNNTWQPQAPSGVPVGTIVAFTANVSSTFESKNNWLVCDGRLLKKNDYSELYDLIGIANTYGSNTVIGGEVYFKIPDYRGMFLRGNDSTSAGRANNDPDYNSRTGSSKIGSVQPEDVKSHSHKSKQEIRIWSSNLNMLACNAPTSIDIPTLKNNVQNTCNQDGDLVRDYGGSETRPKNIAVNWIIKAK